MSVFDATKTVGKPSPSAFQRFWFRRKRIQREKVMGQNSLRTNPIQNPESPESTNSRDSRGGRFEHPLNDLSIKIIIY